jgi:hypothetical protein
MVYVNGLSMNMRRYYIGACPLCGKDFGFILKWDV